ncbi:MAG: O-antigen ligase domain-containing protein [Waterburya sp.]
MLNSSAKKFSLLPQPGFAWLAIFGFISVSATLLATGIDVLLNLFFPVAAFGLAVFLYFRAPVLYVGFTWWLWFLTPLVRRLSDWRSNVFTEPSPILLTPFLVTLVSIITLWRMLPKTSRQAGLPFLLSFAAIAYGIVVGLIFRERKELVINSLDWLVPVIFGFHLFANWRRYPIYRQNMQKVFLWGVLIMGLYGVIQFCTSPPWDAYWLLKAEFETGSNTRTNTLGTVATFTINVWSTMTSNRPFGTVMMAGLVLLLVNNSKGIWGIPAAIFGYLSFLLARKRVTWISWLIAIFLLLSSLKSQTQKRVIAGIIALFVVLIPLSNIEPFSEFIYSRLETFSELESDGSANARLETFENLSDDALKSFVGQGIGGAKFDSGILSSLLDIGWLGSISYFGGVLLLFASLYQNSSISPDPFISAARAISLSVFMQIPLGRSHVEAQGLILWGFLSMAVAGQRYYLYRYRNPDPVDEKSSSSSCV